MVELGPSAGLASEPHPAAPQGGGPSTRAIVRIFLTVVGLAATLYLAYLIRSVLGLIFIAVFLAIALGPPVGFFERKGLPRGLSILLVYLGIGLVIVGVGLMVIPPVVEQVTTLSDRIPEYLQDLRRNEAFRDYDDRYDITDRLTEQARELPSRLGDAAGALQAVTVGVFSAVVQLVTVLTMTFFLLLDGRRLVTWGMGLVEPRRRERLEGVAAGIYRSVSGYVAGALTISTINGFLSYLVMTILGVPFAVPLAVLMAFLGLIPLVGATIGAVIIALVTAFNDFPTDTIVWVIYAVLYQQAENNLLQPMVYRRAVNVHPLIVIVAILIGASLLGVLGALVAIPVAATVQIVVKDLWEHRRTPAEELLDLPAGVEEEPAPAPKPVGEPEPEPG